MSFNRHYKLVWIRTGTRKLHSKCRSTGGAPQWGALHAGRSTWVVVLFHADIRYNINGFSLAFQKEPFKRPLSSSAPTVVVDRTGQVRMALGASGGSKIITAVLQVLLGVVSGCANVRDAVDRPRVHHQLEPMHISGEGGVPANIRVS